MNIIDFPSRQQQVISSSPAVQQTTQPSVDVVGKTHRASTLHASLGDKGNLATLGLKLYEIAARLAENPTADMIKTTLQTTPMAVRPESSDAAALGSTVNLAAFIQGKGLGLPYNLFSLTSLADAVSDRALQHPLGNLSGALSWPNPLSPDQQRRMRDITQRHDHAQGEQPLVMQTKGVLDFLSYPKTLSPDELVDPVKALNTLIGSAAAQRLGQTLQHRLGGIATENSANDYLLAAINLHLDPESISAPHRNKVAGFDLMQEQHWGEPAAVVVEGLRQHLITQRKSSPLMANAGAYLLLANKAPEFLVKDLPGNLTYGSPAWVSLSVAAATIEAQSPGTAANMTFAQVMIRAEHAAMVDPVMTERARKTALADWGVANGVIDRRGDDQYSSEQLDSVRATFNVRLGQRLSASQALNQAMPMRRDIALAKLVERFGDLGALFEEKLLATHNYAGPGHRTSLVGDHSLLDIAMMDLPSPAPFVSADSRLPLAALNANPRFGVTEAFDQQFDTFISGKKSAIGITVKHLIAQLPLEHRRNFEFGKITLFQQTSHTLGLDFTSKTPGPKQPRLLVKTERNGVASAYEIDFHNGTVQPAQLYKAREQRSRDANRVQETKVFTPAEAVGELSRERTSGTAPPDSFNSARSEAIAAAFVEHLALDDPAIKEEARGKTTGDRQHDRAKAFETFLLNLVPLRAAIVNFQNGNYGDGAMDLALDVFGFLTAGMATAGKVAKIGATAISTASKALRATKVIGTAAIGAFNPLGGFGDLAVGSVSFAVAKGSAAINRLRGATGSYDVLKAMSKDYDAAAIGTLNVAERRVDGAAVLKDGRWYAFDADVMQPYGSPLEDFTAHTRAVDGAVSTAHIEHTSELDNAQYRQFKVAESNLDGLTRNSQGVYVAADGHRSHMRHTDSSGDTAVYEVRQVTRTEEGVVQARIYHNNRQTELLVQHVQDDQWQHLAALGGAHIDATHLRAWEALSTQEQQRLTLKGFARQHRLNLPTLTYYVQPDGTLSAAGVIVRDRAAGAPSRTLTPHHLRDWQGMTQQARDAATMEGFASLHHLDVGDFKSCVKHTGGLLPRGEALLFRAGGGKYNQLTDDHLLKWHRVSRQPNNRVTQEAFRRQHTLNPVDWRTHVYSDGSFNTSGARRLSRAQENLATQPAARFPAPGATRKRPAPDNMPPAQDAPLDLSKPADGDPPAAAPIIKTEPEVVPLRTLATHSVDNTLPILQDPANPRLSLTQAIEGPIDDIRIAHWYGLLDGLEPAQKKVVANRIKDSIKDWLRSEGSHGPRFDQMLEVVTPLDDGGPARGASVWARRDIAQFEVLGPYAGKYHATDASLFQEQRKQGSRAVLTYLFGTRSGTRSVSALNSGNTLSLVNTSQLRNGPAWQSNNVISIAVGKNLSFYVALKDIKAGDELLLDYGPLYDVTPGLVPKQEPAV
ncbi:MULTISPECIES: SET domain-containing protein-lysine N-methyltransferase [unclassified Pseudomonas]|uniref:SET domain-containing protein-lysine N-methyltransferase n=1 Tax=unclassified Pseudomonas TaxID=196821 RepID=UPI0030DC1413